MLIFFRVLTFFYAYVFLTEVPPPTEEEDEYDTEEGTVEETEEGDEEEEEEEELSPKKQIKRKASGLAPKKTKVSITTKSFLILIWKSSFSSFISGTIL